MKVRIVTCEIAGAWYEEIIGAEFNVFSYDKECWMVPYPFIYWEYLPPLLILKSDCKKIKDG